MDNLGRFDGRKLLITALAIASLPVLVGFSLPGEFARLIKAGNAHYGAARFKKADADYDKALRLEPDSSEALFNRGAARYRQGLFEEALTDSSNAARGAEDELQVYAEYNAGNCAFRLQKLEDAIARYKRALTLDPTDQWAKHNLEFALRTQEQKKEEDQEKPKGDEDQEKDQQDQQDRQDQEQQQEQQKDQQQKDQGQDDQNKQDQQDKQDKQQPQDQQDQQQEQQEEGSEERQSPPQAGDKSARKADATPLTPQQAAQLLSSLAQEDADLQKIIRRAPMTEERPAQKDW